MITYSRELDLGLYAYSVTASEVWSMLRAGGSPQERQDIPGYTLGEWRRQTVLVVRIGHFLWSQQY